MPDLFDVLLHFRYHQIALISDIEKAFFQVSIAPEHRDFLRFIVFQMLMRHTPRLSSRG